jgi:hypothetical protein
MKAIIISLITVFCYFLMSLSVIWAIIEFILYLVKDRQFNWWSVIAVVIFGILAFIFGITILFIEDDKPSTEQEKSVFAKRLEEIKKIRESENKNKS